MKVAITGASGHLGTVVIFELIRRGYQVKALVYNQKEVLKDLPVEIVKGSVLDTNSLENLMKGCDAVIHCAAIISINGDLGGKLQQTNVGGVKNVMDTALKVGIGRVIHVSSIHAYNNRPEYSVLDETREFVGNKAAVYDQSKRDGQKMAISYFEKGLDVIVVNPTGMIGPPDFRPSLMGQAILDIYHKRIPALFNGGFDFSDIRDSANAICNALKKGTPGHNYLLPGKWHSMAEIKSMIEESSGRKIKIPFVPVAATRIGLPFVKLQSKITGKQPLYTKDSIDALVYGNRYISSLKAEQELEYACRPLHQTIDDLLKWYEGGRNKPELYV